MEDSTEYLGREESRHVQQRVPGAFESDYSFRVLQSAYPTVVWNRGRFPGQLLSVKPRKEQWNASVFHSLTPTAMLVYDLQGVEILSVVMRGKGPRYMLTVT